MQKKVLVISHNCFSKTYNNGKTISAIFSAFKENELCQLFFTYTGSPDYERCENYYYISDRDALGAIFKRSLCGKSINALQNESNKIESISTKKGNIKIKKTKLSKCIRSIIMMACAWYRGGLRAWIEKQQPNMIFYVGGDSFFSHHIAVTLSRKLSLPLVSYFTDDYIINPPIDLYNLCLRKIYKKTISRSVACFAIGEQMSSDYTSFFGCQFKPIMNIVDIPNLDDYKSICSDTIFINYFGGLHLGRARQIIRFANFYAAKIRGLVNKKYEINIYSFAVPSEEEKKEMDELGIIIHPGVAGSELTEKMRESTLLLHVESIQKEYHMLTKLSVSTKIPEYMCLNKPIIAFGPVDVASFRVIIEADPSLVINDVEDDVVMEKQAKNIAMVLNSSDSLERISRNNYNYAKSHFDKTVVSKLFRNEIEPLLSK